MRAKLKTVLLFCILLSFSFPAFSMGETASFTNDAILNMVQNKLPTGWEIVDKIPDRIPRGHYWGLEYKGRSGQEIVIQGPADVNFCWRSRDGKIHHAALAKEAIEIWIMPTEYDESWKRHFMPHRPIPAELIASGGAGRVYGFQTHRIVKKNEFDTLLKQATHTSWPDSPHDKRGTLSWMTWRKDLSDILKCFVEKTE